MNRLGRTRTKFANFTTPELLRYVNRSQSEIAELTYRLEDALDDLQELIEIVDAFPGVSMAADARLCELNEILDEYRNMFCFDDMQQLKHQYPTTEANNG